MSYSQRHTGAVYYALTGDVDVRGLEQEWAQFLTADEARKLDKLVLPRDRRDYLCAHLLLRRALAAERGLDPKEVPPAERNGWSLTHTAGFVACAVAADPAAAVGVDAEHLTAAQRLAELTHVFMTAAENAALPSDPNGRAERMVEIWTAKEAVLKARGEGFSGEEGFRVLLMLESSDLGMLDGWATISVRDARTGAAYSAWRRWVGSHVVTFVAIEGNEGEPRLIGVSLQ